MNAHRIEDPDRSNRILNLVAFKWLMAGIGWWIDLSRLQSDNAYVEECLQRALTSDSELLRKCGVEMLGLRRDSDVHCGAAMSSTFNGLAM